MCLELWKHEWLEAYIKYNDCIEETKNLFDGNEDLCKRCKYQDGDCYLCCLAAQFCLNGKTNEYMAFTCKMFEEK